MRLSLAAAALTPAHLAATACAATLSSAAT